MEPRPSDQEDRDCERRAVGGQALEEEPARVSGSEFWKTRNEARVETDWHRMTMFDVLLFPAMLHRIDPPGRQTGRQKGTALVDTRYPHSAPSGRCHQGGRPGPPRALFRPSGAGRCPRGRRCSNFFCGAWLSRLAAASASPRTSTCCMTATADAGGVFEGRTWGGAKPLAAFLALRAMRERGWRPGRGDRPPT